MHSRAERLPVLIRARLLQMMLALERVGGTPIEDRSLHAFAYFANVLSPLWDIRPLDDSVIKQANAPYFPSLQRQIDFLVGRGLIVVEGLLAVKFEGFSRLEATFRLATARANPVIAMLNQLPDEAPTEPFLLELADAFIRIRPDRRDEAAEFDASYSDPAIAEGRFVNFRTDELDALVTPSLVAAGRFQDLVPSGITLTNGQKLVMYMHLMKRRADG